MEGFFPLRSFEEEWRLGIYYCLDLCSAHCPNWPEMESFLSLLGFEQDERDKLWDVQTRRVQSSMRSSITVTIVVLTESSEARLVMSVEEFLPSDLQNFYLDSDPWLPMLTGGMPLTPHHIHPEGKIKFRKVQFGWNMERNIIAFCLSDGRMR